MIPTWWPRTPVPGNLGDVLTPRILAHYGIPYAYADRKRARLIATGSIVRFAMPGMAVLGSGAMRESDRLCPDARYLAVRGPLTREFVRRDGGSVERMGDPALLLPRFYEPDMTISAPVGLVPHYIDRTDPQVLASGMRTIDPLRADPRDVVAEICHCGEIYSSSLHGIIVAHAYGIPAAWVRFGDRLSGDDTKFRDYAASVGIDLVPYRTIEEARPVMPKRVEVEARQDDLEAALRELAA